MMQPCAACSPSPPTTSPWPTPTARHSAGDRTARGSGSAWLPRSTDPPSSAGTRQDSRARPTPQCCSQLRAIADVIVVGAGTVRDEGYGPPRKSGQRIGVVTRSGDVDLSSALFTSGAGFLITTEDATFDTADIDVVRAGTGTVDFATAIDRLSRLISDCGVVQAEGGAILNGGLLDGDVIDEINLTTSPVAVGGTGPRLAAGADNLAHRFDLAQLAIDDRSFLFARWLRRRG